MEINKEHPVAYICNYCGEHIVEIEGKGVEFFPVEDANGVIKATCSLLCAKGLRDKIIKSYQQKIDKVKKQKLKRLKW